MITSLINPYPCPDTDFGTRDATPGHPGFTSWFKIDVMTNKGVIALAVMALFSAVLLLSANHYGSWDMLGEWLLAHLIFVIFGPLTLIVVVVKFVTKDVPNPLVATVLLLMASVIFVLEENMFIGF